MVRKIVVETKLENAEATAVGSRAAADHTNVEAAYAMAEKQSHSVLEKLRNTADTANIDASIAEFEVNQLQKEAKHLGREIRNTKLQVNQNSSNAAKKQNKSMEVEKQSTIPKHDHNVDSNPTDENGSSSSHPMEIEPTKSSDPVDITSRRYFVRDLSGDLIMLDRVQILRKNAILLAKEERKEQKENTKGEAKKDCVESGGGGETKLSTAAKGKESGKVDASNVQSEYTIY
jgi:hypothetical protein